MITQTLSDAVSKTTAELHVYADGTLGNDTTQDGFQRSAGTGGSFAAATVLANGLGTTLDAAAGVVTLTSAGTPGFTAALIGQRVSISGATTPAHNGNFVITAVPSTTQLRWANAATLPASEGYVGTWATVSVVVTFTGTGAAWTTADVGKLITIDYAANSAVVNSSDNNGSFLITSLVSATQVTYVNARGVTGAMPAAGKWSVSSPKKTLAAVFNLIPMVDTNAVVLHLSGTFTDTGSLERLPVSPGSLTLDGGGAVLPLSALSGVGDGVTGLTKAGSNITLTSGGTPNFTSALVGKTICILSSGTMGFTQNNGTFPITAVTSPTMLVYTNSGGSTEATFAGPWYILPFDTVDRGIGDSLTFTAGPNTVDLVDAGAAFTRADLGKTIVIAGSTGNDGSFIITAVNSSTSVTWVNGASLGNEPAFAGTWTLAPYMSDVANSGTVDTIGFAGAGWRVDDYAGCWVEILSSGVAALVGQTRLIQGNSATALTPCRPFSAAPVGTTTFRIVRPATLLSGTGTLNLNATAPGALYVQRFSLTGTRSLGVAGSRNPYFSHIFSTTTNLSTLFAQQCDIIQCRGQKINPWTLSTSETTNLFSNAGISHLNWNLGAFGIWFRTSHLAVFQASYSSVVLFFKMQGASFTSGSRARQVLMLSCEALAPANAAISLTPEFSSTPLYATSKIGGLMAGPFPVSSRGQAGLNVIRSSVGIGNVDFSGVQDYGIEIENGLVVFQDSLAPGNVGGVATGTAARAGVYAHSNSTVILRTQFGNVLLPTLTGTTLGDLTTDDTTPAAYTWLGITGNVLGVGDSITAPVANVQTLTDAAGTFTGAMVGKWITITGAATGNNGTFLVLSNPGPTQVTYTNAAGVVEPGITFAWTVSAVSPTPVADAAEFVRVKNGTNLYG